MDAAGSARRVRGAREQRRRPPRARDAVPRRDQGLGAEVRRAQQQAADRLQVELAQADQEDLQGQEASARKRRTRLRQYKRCRFRHIQSAVNRAKSNDRIQILPGVYSEEPSRQVPVDQAECASMFETPDDGDAPVPTFEHQVKCPNSRNLIAIIGDSLADPDRECDQKCNLLIEGLGRKPKDVLIEGDRLKKDVIRADRADGFYLRNVWVEQGAFNDVDVVETNGFQLRQLVTPYGQNYGVLTLRLRPRPLRAHRGVRQRRLRHLPGLRARGPLQALRDRDPQRQLAPQRARLLGHGGQRHVDAQLEVPPQQRRHLRRLVRVRPPGHAAGLLEVGHQRRSTRTTRTTSPTTATPTARTRRSRSAARRSSARSSRCRSAPASSSTASTTNLIQNNTIYDNWRSGVRLFWVPAAIRGENDPAQAVRHLQRQQVHPQPARLRRRHAASPTASTSSGTSRASATAGRATSRPAARSPATRASLPGCPQRLAAPARPTREARRRGAVRRRGIRTTNPDPPGCTWFTTPPKPTPMKWWLAATVLLLAGVGALLLLGDRDGGATQAATDTARLQWKEKPSLILVPELPQDRILTGQAPQRLAARGRPRDRAGADPRRRRAAA